MGRSEIEAKRCYRYQAREQRVKYAIITFGFAVCCELRKKRYAQRTRKQFLQAIVD